MKRIITALLTTIMLTGCFMLAQPVLAQDNGVMFSFSYAEKNNGIVDKKQTASLEKAKVDGIEALKITPTPTSALTNEIRIDCYSLDYSSKQLEGAKYIAVKYRYDGKEDLDQSMAIHLFKSGGALTSTITAYSGKIKCGEWQIAYFDISSLGEKLDLSADKKFTQFHFWPYGKDSVASMMNPGQVMYIGDIMFCSKVPEGIKLPALSTPKAEYVDMEKDTDGKPAIPGAPEYIIASEKGFMFSFNYAEKHNGIVDKKQTATLDTVNADGRTALQIIPTPDTAQSNEIRIDCYSLSYTPQELYGAKYLTVEYKYMGEEDLEVPMTVQLFKTDGALKTSMMLNSKDKIKCGDWTMAVFDISQINANLDFSEDKKFSQFHFWPYGRDTRVANLSVNKAMYIGEFAFHSKAPEGSGIIEKPSEPLVGDENGFLVGFNYQDENNGIVDGKKTAVLEKVTEDGEKALKIVPSPDTALSGQMALDCYNLDFTQNEIANARYMTIKYKYIAPESAKMPRMTVRIFGSSTRAITSTIEVDSLTTLESGGWKVAMFDVSKIKGLLNKANPMAILSQFHLYPFGKYTDVYALSNEHTLYISDIGFYTVNPDPTIRYTVTFKKGHPEAVGANPVPLTLKRNEKYTVPEMPYTLEGGTFLGWKNSVDGKLYEPGTEMTVPDANVLYSAQFSVVRANEKPYLALDFKLYHNGSVNSLDNIRVTEEKFLGKETVKIVPNPKSTSAGKNAVVDGYSYAKAQIDLEAYRYLVITYYLDGEMPAETRIYGNILKSGVLTKNIGALSAPLESGRWNFALLDFSGVGDILNPDVNDHILQQMHLYVFDGPKPADMTGNEALYINSLMFFKEKPDLGIHESYMKGYDGGTFRPQGNMTRAEACTIVARLSAGTDDLVPTDKTTSFADVTADKWYHKYISYVESLGYLASYSGSFEPDKAITRAEFVELVYNMGLLNDAGKNGTFTDVAADHPKAAVVAAAGKAGLVNGYDNGDGTFSFKPDNTITRAEVVKVINNAYRRSITADKLSEEARFSFSDVENSFWAYADIMEATISHVEDKNGWVFCMVSPYTVFGRTNDNLDYAAGESYLKELDTKSDEKKQAVKNAPNMDLSGYSGKKYYISNNGNDENDGLTPDTAWKTVGRMVKEYTRMNAGDVVLFERGGTWRERFSTKSGITYTAYGNGAKPCLYGSPENGADASKWTLLEGTSNIWVYATELPEVGGIICDGGKAVGLKELPDLSGKIFYVRNTGKTKVFDVKAELSENYEFFSEIPSTSIKNVKGKLYFRCDEGNPGEIFSQIEFNTNGSVIANGDAVDTHFDNLCIMYTGTHGISSHSTKNMTVTNCEIGWIGGTIMSYGNDGAAARLGNGIEIYGGVDGYTVKNNYIYQCYDAGATHQYSAGGSDNISMYNIIYSGNIIEDCIYSIEYFNGASDNDIALRDGRDLTISGNILRRAGYGWGNQRPDSNTCAHIKSWAHSNEYEPGTFIIENNIFDRSSCKLVQTRAAHDVWCPVYRGNTYIQYIDGGLAEHKQLDLDYNCYAEQTVKYELCDDEAKVYFLPESYKYSGFLTR